MLVVGDRAWHLRYESTDWRKNVGGTVTVISPPDGSLVARGLRTARALGLPVVGLDYVVTSEGPALLEANAYPGLDDVPEAADAFVGEVARWWAAIAE